MTRESEWTSNDPQRWSRYWAAYYQLEGAERVCVDEYCRTEKAAQKLAEEKLSDALRTLIDLGLNAAGKTWTVHWMTREQTKREAPVIHREYVVRKLQGRLQIVSRDFAEQEGLL